MMARCFSVTGIWILTAELFVRVTLNWLSAAFITNWYYCVAVACNIGACVVDVYCGVSVSVLLSCISIISPIIMNY